MRAMDFRLTLVHTVESSELEVDEELSKDVTFDSKELTLLLFSSIELARDVVV